MGRIQTPANIIRLTNVAIVRLDRAPDPEQVEQGRRRQKRHKKRRFEVACYKNKIQAFRDGVETDLDEVLQIHNIFFDVSRGQAASSADLMRYFGTRDRDEVIALILREGRFQSSEQERSVTREQLFRQILHHIIQRCINLDSEQPFTVPQMEEILRDIGFSVNMRRSAKIQALEVIKDLVERGEDELGIPIARAMMRVRVILKDSKTAGDAREKLSHLFVRVFDEDWHRGTLVGEYLIEPGSFRELQSLASEHTSAACDVFVASIAEIAPDEGFAEALQEEGEFEGGSKEEQVV